jgi:hypothetical protein
MPQGDKRKYTDKQKRQAEHIEEGYEARGLSEEEAERRAWATVNAVHGGGEKPGGGGYGKPENREPMRRGGRKGGRAAAGRKKTAARKTSSARKSSAKKTTSRKKTTGTRKRSAAKKR